MESSQRLPRFPPNPLHRNRVTWKEFRRTPFRHHRRRTGVRSRTDSGIQTNRQKEITEVPNTLERIFPSSRLMGTSESSTRPRINRTIQTRSGSQIFPKGDIKHQLPIGLGDPTKTESPKSTSGISKPPRGRIFKDRPRNRQGFQVWKQNPGLTYQTNGKRGLALTFKQ